ncbi:hypothetical protein ElyMa_001947100 [Elysia marginata]|uniref:Retrotransposon gag domain-containing protein n=1 Tax=Elysia marginata TaxID=1093978 RepID=A0AAV4EWF2_9GAST|nr:hypothetical protein ElyMa_001947100 [Elysia marginata]
MELGATSLRPPIMDFENGNIAANWRRWSQNMQLLLSGPLMDKTEEQKFSYFLIYIGQAGRDIYNTWDIAEGDKKLDILFQRFQTYCRPKNNVTMARFKFNSRKQKMGENIDQCVTDLRLLANDCEFGELKDSLIRDRIICDTNDSRVREKLLQEHNPPLDKAIEIARSMEATK